MECVNLESNILHSFNQKLDWNYHLCDNRKENQIWRQFLRTSWALDFGEMKTHEHVFKYAYIIKG